MPTKAEALAELARRGHSVTAPKMMPASVVKQEGDDLDVMNLGSGVNARMNPYANDLEAKKLDLGIGRNVFMGAQNLVGATTPASREFSDFRADLEKMRNDSLRLNKGVQTEGDAQRAWNELFKHLNDEKLVAQRLREIQSYNDSAIKYHQAKIGERRSLYGIDPPDYSKFTVKPDAFGTTKQPAPKPAPNPGNDPRKLQDADLLKMLGLGGP